MKTVLVPAILILASGLSAAQEMGRVISSTPVIQQVAQPRQVCANETVAVQPQSSGAGAAMGAIAGGALGNGVGGGSGRAAATIIGLIGGAMLGDRIEGRGQPQYQNVQRCSTQHVVENQTAYYNVVYEYAGKQYSVQMPQDPGAFIPLQVTPANSVPQGYAPPATAPQAVYTQPQVVYTQPPVVVAPPVVTYSNSYYPYNNYYAQPVRPPVGVNLQFGYVRERENRPYWRPDYNDRH